MSRPVLLPYPTSPTSLTDPTSPAPLASPTHPTYPTHLAYLPASDGRAARVFSRPCVAARRFGIRASDCSN
jgi:hypothetical protein